KLVTGIFVVGYLVCATGCLHEDALADAADGFGGGWNREQILMILRQPDRELRGSSACLESRSTCGSSFIAVKTPGSAAHAECSRLMPLEYSTAQLFSSCGSGER